MPSPIGHILSGMIIASVPLSNDKPTTKRLLTGAFFAVAPDLDMFLVFAGIDYIYAHRTFSHSLVTVALIAASLKLMNMSMNAFSKKNKIPWMLISTCLVSHIFLDMLGKDTYGPHGLMLFWPLSKDFYYLSIDLFYGLMDTQGNPLPINKMIFAVSWEIGLIGCGGMVLFMMHHFFKKKKELIQ